MTAFSKYYFIVNPAAGAGRKLQIVHEIQEECRRRGLTFETAITHYPKEAITLARNAAAAFEVIVAVGGDGTVNEVVNGIAGSSAVLGIVPTGSGNDFAPMLGISKSKRRIFQVLFGSTTRTIDIGKVNNKQYFVNAFGVGFDGEVASRVKSYVTYGRGFVAYLLAVFRTLITYRFRRVRIAMDNGQAIEQEIFLAAACNGTTYGGGFNIAPSAKIDDGTFTVCVIDTIGRFYALRNIPKIMRGTHVSLPVVHTFTSACLSISSQSELHAHIDGEVLPMQSRFEITMLPRYVTALSA